MFHTIFIKFQNNLKHIIMLNDNEIEMYGSDGLARGKEWPIDGYDRKFFDQITALSKKCQNEKTVAVLIGDGTGVRANELARRGIVDHVVVVDVVRYYRKDSPFYAMSERRAELIQHWRKSAATLDRDTKMTSLSWLIADAADVTPERLRAALPFDLRRNSKVIAVQGRNFLHFQAPNNARRSIENISQIVSPGGICMVSFNCQDFADDEKADKAARFFSLMQEMDCQAGSGAALQGGPKSADRDATEIKAAPFFYYPYSEVEARMRFHGLSVQGNFHDMRIGHNLGYGLSKQRCEAVFCGDKPASPECDLKNIPKSACVV
ncbi:MAG: hypothetical protein K2Q32_09225 [Alphaproteobacteria bacterium]|nr:hypothetical protein [Alphaproteobacteria bacterium]